MKGKFTSPITESPLQLNTGVRLLPEILNDIREPVRLTAILLFVVVNGGFLACTSARVVSREPLACRPPDDSRNAVVVAHLRSFLTDRDPEARDWRERLGLSGNEVTSVRLVTDEPTCRTAQRAREAAAAETLRDRQPAHLPIHAYRVGPYIAVDDPEERWGSYHTIWLFDREWRVVDRIGL